MPNALQHETSPYLLQHADNPVDWRPWGDEALARARDLDKPILLSIGYSACHWCHVMAHESFEDDETAALMNDLYVNVKVDREERPDLDRIYQISQQLFTGRPGGWPLTMFLTPERQWPIFAGTYFPKSARYGMPAFRTVLERVASYYRSHRDEIEQNGRRLLDALNQLQRAPDHGDDIARGELREAARRRLGESYDAANGGFGQAPKFPHPAELRLLLTSAEDGDDRAETMLSTSLRAMAAGGLYDHLGGGFFRYCVDREWRIPHFEKMLYDNAALLALFSEAYAATGTALYGRAAAETADWILRDMRDPNGGFYSTLDADSEGQEGKFYTFTADQFDDALDRSERDTARAYFGLEGPANFEGESWHLQPRSAAAKSELPDDIARAKAKLLRYRERRSPPPRDDKELTAWNGLMIGALAKAARYLDRPDLGQAAADAADFVAENAWRSGRLFASFKDGRARFPAYLDDHAFVAAGLIELLQQRFRARDLRFAIALVDCLLERFADPAGGFFFTADDHERLMHRPKPLADEAVPSGNGVAAVVLDTLGHLLGETRYLDAARMAVDAALPLIARHPEAHASLLLANDRQLDPPEMVIVRGSESELAQWRRRIDRGFHHDRLLFFIPSDVTDLPGVLRARAAADTTIAYLCKGTECLAPIPEPDELLEKLGD